MSFTQISNACVDSFLSLIEPLPINQSNILMSEDGRPLLAGLEMSVSLTSLFLAVTTSHGSKRSWRWMAKELFQNNDARHCVATDMWAFGMVIFVRLQIIANKFERLNLKRNYWAEMYRTDT